MSWYWWLFLGPGAVIAFVVAALCIGFFWTQIRGG